MIWSGGRGIHRSVVKLRVSARLAALLFFASTKKRWAKGRAPLGYLALLAPPGVGRKLAALKQAPALIRSPLRCSARPHGVEASATLAPAAAPSTEPFTTTASFTNPGEQTRTATSRTNTPIKIGKNQIGC